ncbi:MAG: S8 family serine peptidase [Deltaproteobacteria bacterium]|nr:S8 family serine peptidase [Deltaproteobacteria bacterium]
MNRTRLNAKRRIVRVVWGMVHLVTMLALFSGPASGEEIQKDKRPLTGGYGQVIQRLSENPKIHGPGDILDRFAGGEATSRVIVNLKKPAGAPGPGRFGNIEERDVLRNMVRERQGRLLPALDPAAVQVTNRFRYVFAFSSVVTLKGLEALVESSDVISIEADHKVYAQLAQGISLINAVGPRNQYSGSGLSIAICDTGIDYSHPKLGGGGFPNAKVIGGYDTGEDKTDPMDRNGHGTACAGIAAGDSGSIGDYIGGVAYDARLYALKITDTQTGGSAWTSDMIEAWEWCITHQNDDPDNPIMIISTSFGGDRYFSTCDNASVAMSSAASNAVAAGMTLFVSSGNEGHCNAISWPACISHVNSVGAVYDAHFATNAIGWCVSSESCASKIATPGCSTGWYSPEVPYADRVIVYSNTASFLSMLAPSNWATTTRLGDGYYNSAYGFGGTSAACPYAAGAAACLQSASRSLRGAYLTPAEVKTILRDTGDPIRDGKVDVTIPRVNLGSAIDALAGDSTYYVALSGSCGGKRPCYQTIGEAILDAVNGSTIKIAQGSYDEALVIDSGKDLTLSGGWDASFVAQSATSTIRSMTIENSQGAITAEYLIFQEVGTSGAFK